MHEHFSMWTNVKQGRAAPAPPAPSSLHHPQQRQGSQDIRIVLCAPRARRRQENSRIPRRAGPSAIFLAASARAVPFELTRRPGSSRSSSLDHGIAFSSSFLPFTERGPGVSPGRYPPRGVTKERSSRDGLAVDAGAREGGCIEKRLPVRSPGRQG